MAESDGDGEIEIESDQEELELPAGPIRGKVAKILNLTDLVINRGAVHGVDVGVEFVILNPNASNIEDPETGRLIGSLPVGKTIVKIVNVQDSMSIARTFRRREGRPGLAVALTSSSFVGTPARTETLKTDESRASQELDERDSLVKTGDDAVEVLEGDEYLLPPF